MFFGNTLNIQNTNIDFKTHKNSFQQKLKFQYRYYILLYNMGKGQTFYFYQIRHIVDTNVLFPRCVLLV